MFLFGGRFLKVTIRQDHLDTAEAIVGIRHHGLDGADEFGAGSVTGVDGNNIVVKFDASGEKRVLAGWVTRINNGGC